MKHRHLKYGIIGLTEHLLRTVLSFLVIFLLTSKMLETVYTVLEAQGLTFPARVLL